MCISRQVDIVTMEVSVTKVHWGQLCGLPAERPENRHSVYLGTSFPICKMELTQYGHIMGLLQNLNKIHP